MICGNACRSYSAMNWHIRIKHENKKIFWCMIRGNAGRSNSVMNWHIWIKHENKKIFGCMKCGNAGRSNSVMNWHIWIKHVNKKIFVCMICGNAGRSNSDLQSSRKMYRGYHEKLATRFYFDSIFWNVLINLGSSWLFSLEGIFLEFLVAISSWFRPTESDLAAGAARAVYLGGAVLALATPWLEASEGLVLAFSLKIAK